MKPPILAFVEDAGAANYLAPLVLKLSAAGWPIRFMAGGVAREYCARHAVPIEPMADGFGIRPLLENGLAKIVMVGTSENPDSPAYQLIDAARALHIPTIGAIDSSTNTAFRFRGRGSDSLRYAPDWLMVPDDYTRQGYIELGFDENRVVNCGHPIYDSVAATRAAFEIEGKTAVQKRVLPDAGNQPIFVFLSELSDGVDPSQFRRSADYTLHGRGVENGRTEIVLEEVLDACALVTPRPYLVLRLHPKQDQSLLKKYSREFDFVSEGGSPLDVVYAADLVIGMTTSLLLEAAILGSPTLSVLPRALERQWLATVRTAVTPAVTDRAALRLALATAAQGIPSQGAPLEEAIRLGASFRCLELVDRIEKEWVS